MKTIIICVALFGPGCLNSYAQEFRIKQIPYTLYFENNPLSYEVHGDSTLEISASGKTDLFISPDGNYQVNNSPRLLFKPDSNFILTSKIELDFNSNWDAGALIIYNDNKHFAKFCYESDYQGKPRIVSVVCNETADDCNSMIIENGDVYYRIIGSTKNNVFNFYFSNDCKSWFLIRTFRLQKFDNIAIGFSVQSPLGKGCIVEFSNIELIERKPLDWWKGE